MPDYSKGKVYKLIYDGAAEIYIGSTTQKLYKRLAVHKCIVPSETYCSSQPLFEKGNVKIIPIEDYPCEKKRAITRKRKALD